MDRVKRRLAIALILTMALLTLAPITTLADNPPALGVNVNVNVGGSGGLVSGNIGVNGGGTGVSVPIGSGASSNPAANVNANVGVGNPNGSAASGNVSANVGGGNGANANTNATVGGGSVANANVDGGGSVATGNANANVGSNNPADPAAAVNANAGVGNNPNGTSLVGTNACVEVSGSCPGTTSTSPISAPLANGTVCLVVEGACTPAGPTGNGTTPPVSGVNLCVAAPGTCAETGNPPPSLVTGTVCVVVDGNCTTTGATSTGGTAPGGGVNLCVAVPGSCDPGTPNGSGVGVGVGTGGVGACIIVLESCATTTIGNPDGNFGGNPGGNPIGNPGGNPIGNPVGGTTPIGTIPGTGTTPGGSIQLSAASAEAIFANPGVTLNGTVDASGLCAFPLSGFSRDNGLSGTLIDCATVHVIGQRAAGSGYGDSQDGPAAGASTGLLGNSGKVSADLAGTCTGCDSAYGSGSGYKAFVQLKDSATGDFINVGIAHDAAPNLSGQSATGVTLVVETGHKTASGYDVSQGYIPSSTNRIPSGHATIMLVWTAQGVSVYVNGIIPPGENAARPLAVGTYSVHMSQPVASFEGAAKSAGDHVDTTFSAISFG
jgi:hypothetical protein